MPDPPPGHRGQLPGQQPGVPLTWRKKSPRGPRRQSPPGRGRSAAGSSGTGTSRSSAVRDRGQGPALDGAQAGGEGWSWRPLSRPRCSQTAFRSVTKARHVEEAGNCEKAAQSLGSRLARLLPGAGWCGGRATRPHWAGTAAAPNSPPIGGSACSSLGPLGDFSSLHRESPTSPAPCGGLGLHSHGSGLSPSSPRPPWQPLPSSGAPPGG